MRLRFACDAWRYTNVLWLIDWFHSDVCVCVSLCMITWELLQISALSLIAVSSTGGKSWMILHVVISGRGQGHFLDSSVSLRKVMRYSVAGSEILSPMAAFSSFIFLVWLITLCVDRCNMYFEYWCLERDNPVEIYCLCLLLTDTSLWCQRGHIWGHHGICESRSSRCKFTN